MYILNNAIFCIAAESFQLIFLRLIRNEKPYTDFGKMLQSKVVEIEQRETNREADVVPDVGR